MKIKKELFKKVCYNIFENLKKNEYFKFEDLQEAIKKSSEIIQFNSLDKKIV